MEKNTIIAVVLSCIVVIVSIFIQYTFFQPTEQIAQTEVLSIEENNVNEQTSVNSVDNEILFSSSIEPSEEQELIEEQTFVIKTDLVEAVLTNKGGDLISYKLLNHKDGEDVVQMAYNITSEKRGFSIALGKKTNKPIDEIFNVKKINENTIGFYKKLSIKNTDGSTSDFTLIKQYTFNPDEYVFKLDIIIDGNENFYGMNFNNAGYTICSAPQMGPRYDQKRSKYENRTFMSFSGEKKKKQMLGLGQTREINKDFTWTGVGGKYFTVLVSPVNNDFSIVNYSTLYDSDPEYANAQVFLTRNPISSQKSQDSFYVYMGPRTESSLKIYNNQKDNKFGLSNMRFNESLESSGLWGWLEFVLKSILEMFYKIVPNWGVAIILMTILLKIVLFPLSKKQSLSGLKMQEVQPKIQELQEKYKNQPQKLNAEMAALYKEKGYNPASGCLPIFIQFPVLIAMYNLFNNYFEFRGAMFIPGWIPDLSMGDNVGIIIPVINQELHILPIIYLISQFISTKIMQDTSPTQQTSNPSMKYMFYAMPLIFFFVIYNSPSGLILYWTLSNLLQLVQQIIINKIVKEKQK
ncbi:MAG: membrane protein insertase YidC [Treponema sp.]|jgi:YidC/Oxa1 family membrane protein insertase|nr:membrane protein insertase YidC [Treponema sp.]